MKQMKEMDSSERGSLVLIQTAIIGLLALVLLLAYPAIQSQLEEAAQRDRCVIQGREKGNELADPEIARQELITPGSTVTALCP